jgi:hypothetical protein
MNSMQALPPILNFKTFTVRVSETKIVELEVVESSASVVCIAAYYRMQCLSVLKSHYDPVTSLCYSC